MGSLSSTPSHMTIADSSGFSDCKNTTFSETGKINFHHATICSFLCAFFPPSLCLLCY